MVFERRAKGGVDVRALVLCVDGVGAGRKDVAQFGQEISEHWLIRRCGSRFIVAAAGSFKKAELVSKLEAAFAKWPSKPAVAGPVCNLELVAYQCHCSMFHVGPSRVGLLLLPMPLIALL